MYLILQLVKSTVLIFLGVLELAMLVRAVLSWFVMDTNGFVNFIHAVTEPFIIPFRLLFEKLNWFQNMPIDMAFLATYLSITAVSLFLT